MALQQTACSAYGEDVRYTSKGKISNGNGDTEMAVEAKSRKKLYFTESLDNLHSRVLEEIANYITNQIAST